MAHMYNMATDWTYDLFEADARRYNATPIKGVHCRANADDRERFMTWFKNCARDFAEEWAKTCPHLYDRRHGWIGDAFANEFFRYSGFSDYYKDTYGQRPHLDPWFYVHAAGFPMTEDTARTFCATPVEDAIERAKLVRERF